MCLDLFSLGQKLFPPDKNIIFVYNKCMSNLAEINITQTEYIRLQTLEQQRRILHNDLTIRILKLKDKIGTNMSLTELSEKLNTLETNINGGCDLEEIELEIIEIEKIVIKHFQNPFYTIRHQGQKLIHKAKQILTPRDMEKPNVNKIEKSN
jgi:hypothetical protein